VKRLIALCAGCLLLLGCQSELPNDLGITQLTLTINRKTDHPSDTPLLMKTPKPEEITEALQEALIQFGTKQKIQIVMPSHVDYQVIEAMSMKSYLQQHHLYTPRSMTLLSPSQAHHGLWFERLKVDSIASLHCTLNDQFDIPRTHIFDLNCLMKVSSVHQRDQYFQWRIQSEEPLKADPSAYGMMTVWVPIDNYSEFFVEGLSSKFN
jgi:hypothetical protein